MRGTCLAALLAISCSAAPTVGPSPSPRASTRNVAQRASAAPIVPPELEAPPPEPAPPPPLPAPELPAISRTSLDSGMAVAVAEIPGAGSYVISLIVEVGGLDDRPGVAQLVAAQLTAGAAATYPRPRDFERAVAELGPMTSDVEAHRISLSLEITAAQLPQAIAHLGKTVARPQMARGQFNQLREAAMQRALAWSRDRPREVATELLTRVLLGDGDPTSRRAVFGTRSELSRIRHGHVAAFYRAHVHPKRSWLLIVGPPPPKDLNEQIEAAFTALGKRAKRKLPPAPKPASELDAPPAPRRVFLIEEPKAAEAEIYAARHGASLTPAQTDVYALLARATRTAQLEPLQPGFVAWATTTAENGEAVAQAKALVLQLDALSVPADRLRHTRARLTTSIPLLAEDPVALSRWLRTITALGLPDDHGLTFGKRIARIAEPDARALLDTLSSAPILIVFGDADVLKEPLRELGQVQIVDPRRGFAVRQTLPAKS